MKKLMTFALAGFMVLGSAASASLSDNEALGGISNFTEDDWWAQPSQLLDNGDLMRIEMAQAGALSGFGGAINTNNVAAAVNAAGIHIAGLGGQVGLWSGRDFEVQLERNTGLPGNIPHFVNAADNGALLAYAGIGAGVLDFANLSRDVEVLWAMNASDTLAVGARVSLISGDDGNGKEDVAIAPPDALAQDGEKYTNKGSGFGIAVGVGLKEVGPLAALDLGVNFDSASAKVSYTNDDAGSVGNSGGLLDVEDKLSVSKINLRLDGEIAGEEISKLFLIGLDMENEKAERMIADDIAVTDGVTGGVGELETETTKLGGMEISVGMAGVKAGEAGYAALGLVLTSASVKWDNEYNVNVTNGPTPTTVIKMSELTLDWMAGGESKVKEWLTLRGGIGGEIFGSESMKTTNNAGAVGVTNTDVVDKELGHVNGGVQGSLGLTLEIGDWAMDAVLNRDLLYGGPNLVTGGSTGMSSQVSVTYAFGGEE